MLSHYISAPALLYAGFRLGLWLASLLAIAWLWRRPRPAGALALVLFSHIAAAGAYLLPLARPYALAEASDRSFNQGMAAAAALGGSVFEHTQVGFASPEPLWNGIYAALAGFQPERVAAAMAALTPIAVLSIGFGVYFGLRMSQPQDQDDWERVLLVFAALGLSSFTLSPVPPAAPFWTGNLLLKPNHGFALGLVALVLGSFARISHVAVLALLLGALAWVFLIDWAYLLPVLFLAAWLLPRSQRPIRRTLRAALASALIALPYVRHLWSDYDPAGSHGAADHMWDDPRGLPLAVPNWSTLDLGPLFVLGLGGAFVLWRRGQPRDRTLLAAVLVMAAMVAASMPLAVAGFAPEPDELHYRWRFALALGAGTALAAAARHLEALFKLQLGQGHLLALAACLPLSFPLYWDPPTMDRYYAMSREPIKPKVLAYARFIRENTPETAVFAGGRSSSSWIPALTGRRVLLAEGGKLMPPDQAARKDVERVLLTSDDPQQVLAAAARYGVTHLAIDEPLCREYGAATFDELSRAPVLRPLFANSAARILAVER